MHSIAKHHSQNIAGLYGLMLALVQDVYMFPEGLEDFTYSSLPTLKAGAEWGVIEFTEESGDLQDSPKGGDAGFAFNPKITLKVAKLCPEISQFIHTYQYAAFVVVAGHSNGISNIIGTPERPCRLSLKTMDAGNKPGDYNGATIELVAKSAEPLYYCAVPYAPPAEPRKVFSNAFSYGFLRS